MGVYLAASEGSRCRANSNLGAKSHVLVGRLVSVVMNRANSRTTRDLARCRLWQALWRGAKLCFDALRQTVTDWDSAFYTTCDGAWARAKNRLKLNCPQRIMLPTQKCMQMLPTKVH